MSDQAPQLRRVLGVGALTAYAVGDILGAGIYALVGPVAAIAAGGTWLSFGVAGAVAALTAFTLAELTSRIPAAGGPASYCRRAFSQPSIAFLVGFLVFASALVSAATISHAFTGYLDEFVSLPPRLTSLAVLGLLALINYTGIEESSRANMAATTIEVAGLVAFVAIAWVAAPSLEMAEAPARLGSGWTLGGVLSGATVAFFAFVGFEDTVTVAEEARDARRSIPRALLTALVVCTGVYIVVTMTAQMALAPDELARSQNPLLDIVVQSTGLTTASGAFALIALIAIGNTGLLNLITASRLAYGMAREGLAPAFLGQVHTGRRTPARAIWLATSLAALLSLSGGLEVLAQTTSLLILTVFTALHAALLRIKMQEPPDGEVFVVPRWIPAAGIAASMALATRFPPEAYLRGAAILALGALLYAAVRRTYSP